MDNDFHKFLIELVLSELPNNRTAKMIAVHYAKLIKSSKEKLFESILSSYQLYSDDQFDGLQVVSDSKSEVPLGLDLRLKSIRIENSRKYPKAKGDVKYGIDFEVENEIKNFVFLGGNGSGKSSLFCALEFLYSQEISEWKLRASNEKQLKKSDYSNYLKHFDRLPFAEITTVTGQFNLANTVFDLYRGLSNLALNNNFISDYSIYDKGKLNCLGLGTDESSFHRLIATSLGLQEYLDFSSLLRAVASFPRRKESMDRKKLLEELEKINESIGNFSKSIFEKSEKISKIKEGIPVVEKVDVESIQRISRLAKQDFFLTIDREGALTRFDELNKCFGLYQSSTIVQDFSMEAQFLHLGLALLSQHDNCPFCMDSTLSKDTMKDLAEKRLSDINAFQTSENMFNRAYGESRDMFNVLASDMAANLNRLKLDISYMAKTDGLDPLVAKELDKLKVLSDQQDSLTEIFDELQSVDGRDIAVELMIRRKNKVLSIFSQVDEVYKSLMGERRLYIDEYLKSNLSKPTDNGSAFVISEIEQDIRALESNIAALESKRDSVQKEIERLSVVLKSIEDMKLDLKVFCKVLDARVNDLTVSSFELIRESVESILKEYMLGDGAYLKLSISEVQDSSDSNLIYKTIVAEVQSLENGKLNVVAPAVFYNTFRYRLFSLMVCLSVVLVTRRRSKINLPLVLDDIFNSSDYASKSTFRGFLVKLLSIFRKFNGDMPLQFILLTHDELIFDCAIDAISEFDHLARDKSESKHIYWQSSIQSQTVFARLFAPQECDDEVSSSRFGDYMDVSFKIPTPTIG